MYLEKLHGLKKINYFRFISRFPLTSFFEKCRAAFLIIAMSVQYKERFLCVCQFTFQQHELNRQTNKVNEIIGLLLRPIFLYLISDIVPKKITHRFLSLQQWNQIPFGRKIHKMQEMKYIKK
jgi:hypothetical protein